MTGYAFTELTVRDLPMVRGWRQAPHVRLWWGEPDVEPEEDKIGHPDIRALIVRAHGRPFAFLQDYRVHAWDDHPFAHLPDGARGLDVYIGEADMLGRGHGTALVRDYRAQLFAAGCPAIGIDPHPDNAAARRAFAKTGFVETAGPLDTRWGRAVLMEARP